jgi:protease-3
LFTQTPVVSNAQLYSRFSAFIEGFGQLLDRVSEEKFAAVKKAHIANYLAKPSSLSDEFSYLSKEWANIKDEINNKEAFIESLQAVTLKEVQSFYEQVLLRGNNRQEILVQVQGEKFRDKPLLRVKEEQKIIDVDLLPK